MLHSRLGLSQTEIFTAHWDFQARPPPEQPSAFALRTKVLEQFDPKGAEPRGARGGCAARGRPVAPVAVSSRSGGSCVWEKEDRTS